MTVREFTPLGLLMFLDPFVMGEWQADRNELSAIVSMSK